MKTIDETVAAGAGGAVTVTADPPVKPETAVPPAPPDAFATLRALDQLAATFFGTIRREPPAEVATNAKPLSEEKRATAERVAEHMLDGMMYIAPAAVTEHLRVDIDDYGNSIAITDMRAGTQIRISRLELERVNQVVFHQMPHRPRHERETVQRETAFDRYMRNCVPGRSQFFDFRGLV